MDIYETIYKYKAGELDPEASVIRREDLDDIIYWNVYYGELERKRATESLNDYIDFLNTNPNSLSVSILEKTILNSITIRHWLIWKEVFKDTALEPRIEFNSDAHHTTKKEVLNMIRCNNDDNEFIKKVLERVGS